MFGKKGRKGEIDVSPFDFLDRSQEFARLWAEQGGPMTCIIEPRALGPDPFLFGMALVDAVRHGAKAYSHATGVPEDQALVRIWKDSMPSGRARPTSPLRSIWTGARCSDPCGNQRLDRDRWPRGGAGAQGRFLRQPRHRHPDAGGEPCSAESPSPSSRKTGCLASAPSRPRTQSMPT